MPLTIVTKRVGPGATGGATQRVVGTLTQDITRRINGVINSTTTVRVPDGVIDLSQLLLLEGDTLGVLSLEGSDAGGYLRLQGVYL